MRFLIDNPLDPALAPILAGAGHDATHVAGLGLAGEPDECIFEVAAASSRVIVSADTDFGTILALRGSCEPSVVLLRRGTPRRGPAVAKLLFGILPDVGDALLAGAIVVVDAGRVRVRRLPIGG